VRLAVEGSKTERGNSCLKKAKEMMTAAGAKCRKREKKEKPP